MNRSEPFVVCRLGPSHYAIPARLVQQLEMVETITRVPGSASYVEGVVYLRGQVVPVVNLRARFGMERIPYDLSARLVVIRVDERVVGLAVDSASEFLTFPDGALQPAPQTMGEQHLSGVVASEERLILILDVSKLLADATLA